MRGLWEKWDWVEVEVERVLVVFGGVLLHGFAYLEQEAGSALHEGNVVALLAEWNFTLG